MYDIIHNPLLGIKNYLEYKSNIENILGNFISCLSHDEDNDLVLFNKNLINRNDMHDLIYNTPSFIFDKSFCPPKVLAYFDTPILINDDAVQYLKNQNYNNIEVTELNDGINVIMYYYNNKWNISTESKLDGSDIKYKQQTKTLFEEVFNYESYKHLQKDYVYYLKLVHHKNNLIISNFHYGSTNKELYIYKMTHINNPIKNVLNESMREEFKKININIIKKETYTNINELIEKIKHISNENKMNKKITIEGYQINIYDTSMTEYYRSYKIQTYIYQDILNIKPINENLHQGYLELYQDDKLKEYLPYFTNYWNEIIHRINTSLKTISNELLNIYHTTRKKNKDIHDNLPESYKNIIFKIHGIYIDSRKNDFHLGEEINKIDTKSITVHDIYHCIKSLPKSKLRQLYFDREILLKNNNYDEYMIKNCMTTILQTKLMKE